MKKTSKKSIFQICFWIFLSIQGVQGAIREGAELIPELKNNKKMQIFKIIKIKNFHQNL